MLLPKAGILAQVQAGVVVERIACNPPGASPVRRSTEMGVLSRERRRAAGYASGDFYAEGAPQMRMRRPGPGRHLARVALERYFMRREF